MVRLHYNKVSIWLQCGIIDFTRMKYYKLSTILAVLQMIIIIIKCKVVLHQIVSVLFYKTICILPGYRHGRYGFIYIPSHTITRVSCWTMSSTCIFCGTSSVLHIPYPISSGLGRRNTPSVYTLHSHLSCTISF